VNETILIFALYSLFLLVFLALPLLAQWRWGLWASLTVTVAELCLVLLLAYSFEPLPPPRPPPERDRDPFTGGWPGDYGKGFAHAFAVLLLVIIPGVAALLGGAFSLVWAAVRASRRPEADRQRTPL
jgi:hypothetical protein